MLESQDHHLKQHVFQLVCYSENFDKPMRTLLLLIILSIYYYELLYHNALLIIVFLITGPHTSLHLVSW